MEREAGRSSGRVGTAISTLYCIVQAQRGQEIAIVATKEGDPQTVPQMRRPQSATPAAIADFTGTTTRVALVYL